MRKITVGLIGATGEVGRSFVECLDSHPYFELNELYASERSAGKRYGDLVTDNRAIGDSREKSIKNISEIKAEDNDIYFSAIPSSMAFEIEGEIARARPIFSTTSAYRYEPEVPIIVPGANEDHCNLLTVQKEKRGYKGFICPQSNCTTVGLVLSLKPLHDRFGVREVFMASHQAVSGAGRELEIRWSEQRSRQGIKIPKAIYYKDKTNEPIIEGNVIPYIKDEERKVINETKKILGRFAGNEIIPASIKIAASCNRVPVKDGHLEDVFIFMEKSSPIEDVINAWEMYRARYQKFNLPSAPSQPIIYLHDIDAPQPRFDISREDGMAVIIGRLQKNELGGLQYKVLSHNTKLGAAKGCVLTAEYLSAIKFI